MKMSDSEMDAAVAEHNAKTASDAKTAKTAIPQPSLDQKKVLQGVNVILEGIQMILDGVAYPQRKLSDERGPVQVPDEDLRPLPITPVQEVETTPAVEAVQTVETTQAMDPPQASEREQAEEAGQAEESRQADASSKTEDPAQPPITKDTLTRVVVSKLKQDRAYSDKINKLVNSYGVTQLSDLPEDKYESFLRELTEM